MIDNLGLSAGGKILLKSVHVSLGDVMAVNLLWPFIWAFFGNRYARWQSILPGGFGYVASLRACAASFLTGEPQQFVGHNPLARIGVSLLLLLLLVQLPTGLVIAGTDLFWPPFSHWFAQWVAAPGIEPSSVQTGVIISSDARVSQPVCRGPRNYLLRSRPRYRAPHHCGSPRRTSRRRQHTSAMFRGRAASEFARNRGGALSGAEASVLSKPCEPTRETSALLKSLILAAHVLESHIIGSATGPLRFSAFRNFRITL